MTPISVDIKSSTVEKLIEEFGFLIGKFSAPALLRKMTIAKGKSLLEMVKKY